MQSGDVSVLQELREDYAAEASILGGNTNLSNLGDTSRALAARQRELRVAERISALEPGNPSSQETLARSLAHMGDQLALVGQRRASLAHYSRAEPMFEDLSRRTPGANSLSMLQSIYIRMYFAQYSSGAKADALASVRRAMEIARQTVRADPQDYRARMSMIIDDVDLAVVHSGMGNMGEALAALNEAISSVAELAASNPGNGELPGIQATVDLTAGDIFAKTGDYDRARRYDRDGVAILARAQAEDAANVDARIDLADAYNALGTLLAQGDDLAGAGDLFHKALAFSEPQVNSSLRSEESLYSVAESYTGLGDVEERGAAQGTEHRIEHLNQARSWYIQSLKMWGQIREPGLLSPGGYECVQPAIVKQRLDAVNRALGLQSP
jgi:tetratricopeptide (TPR) repeat protein